MNYLIFIFICSTIHKTALQETLSYKNINTFSASFIWWHHAPWLAKAVSFHKYKTASKEDESKLIVVVMMTSFPNFFCFLTWHQCEANMYVLHTEDFCKDFEILNSSQWWLWRLLSSWKWCCPFRDPVNCHYQDILSFLSSHSCFYLFHFVCLQHLFFPNSALCMSPCRCLIMSSIHTAHE
jgi:hypothetical protein